MAENNYIMTKKGENSMGNLQVFDIVGPETGVTYIGIRAWGTRGSNTGVSVAVTPRLNRDGSLFISKTS